MTNLEELWLSNNKIKEITELHGLDKLSNLQTLYLNNNQITKLKGLCGLNKLQKLLLFNNQITDLKGLCKLSGL